MTTIPFTGGNDVIVSPTIVNQLVEAGKGDDRLTILGSNNLNNRIYGENEGTLRKGSAGDDLMVVRGGNSNDNKIVGDYDRIIRGAQGGDDTLLLIESDYDNNEVYGDASKTLSGFGTRGGDDLLTLFGGDSDFNKIIGDAQLINKGAMAGRDSLFSYGGDNTANDIWGDGNLNKATGADDTIVVKGRGNDGNEIIGEGARMVSSVAGDDYIEIKGSHNTIIGDAKTIKGTSIAGDDTLIAYGGVNRLYGDGVNVKSSAFTGKDVFGVKKGTGHIVVYDYETGKDKIGLINLDIDDISSSSVTFGSQLSTKLSFGSDVLAFLVGTNETVFDTVGDANYTTL